MQYFWAPKGTPPDRIAFFVDLLRRTMRTATMQEKLEELKMDPVFITGPELRRTLKSRETVMKGVQIDSTIELPDTPLFAIVITSLLGTLLLIQRRTASESESDQTVDNLLPHVTDVVSNTGHVDSSGAAGRSRAVATLTALGLFCLLFATGRVPFWLLSPVFIISLGLMLLKRTRTNFAVLVVSAIVAGPGCYLLFTKVLTIDLP